MNKSLLVAAAVAAALAACSKEEPAPAPAPAPAAALLGDAVRAGARMFAEDHFGSTRTYQPLDGFDPRPFTCEACHAHGGVGPGATVSGQPLPSLVGAAAEFPKGIGGKVFTLDHMINHCVASMGGFPPEYDSQDMADLVAYLTALSRGAPLARSLPPAAH
jgi:thiosulfate dehydrogenase